MAVASLMAPTQAAPDIVEDRARVLYLAHERRLCVRTDKLFAALMVMQWVFGIIVALTISPYAWEGAAISVHIHVFAAVLLGGLITLLPVYLAITRPGETMTRHVIAASQTMYSALLIHLMGGRIEAHFHVFGSLALLAFYRDWRVLVTASAVVAVDHFLRGLYWPQSVYGVFAPDSWRWLEHAAWVAFEDVWLVIAIRQAKSDAWEVAKQRAQLENTNQVVENLVAQRTEQLRASEARSRQLAAIVQQSKDAIVSIAPDGVIMSWNSGAEQMYGYSAEEAVGADEMLIVPPEKRAEAVSIFESLRMGEPVENFETVRCCKDGRSIDVALTAAPVRNEQGLVTSFSSITRDITQKKEVDRRIREFYSTVSHELRTPLASIHGALGLIVDGVIEPGTEEASELLAIARSSSDRLIRLVNDILDLRKIEAGKLELNLADVSAQAIVQSGVADMIGMAETKEIKLITTMDGDQLVRADRDRAVQVLTNLISNAIKFSPQGASVNVTTEVVIGGMLRFSVADQGQGIPADQHHKLFGRFQQIDSSDSRPKEGSGLGLAICKALAEQHGGSVGFVTNPGEGSTFWFELPLGKGGNH